MTDYSKFDKINYDTDSDEEVPGEAPSPATLAAMKTSELNDNMNIDKLKDSVLPTKMTGKTIEGRLKFEYKGQTIYEWEQSLEEVNIYITPPPGLPRKLIDIKIQHSHLSVGVTNTAPFIDEATGGPVKVDESTWTLVDGVINITLCKMNKAETWVCALAGRDGQVIDEITKEEQRKKMMLERFQEEHPSFDFSGAEFNGAVPEAKDFMNGISR